MCGNKLLGFSICSVFCILIFLNCASVVDRKNILALVDEEPITREDLGYSLEISHRREDLSTTKQFDISEYIQKLIDDRLIIQEARRMGLEDAPDVQQMIKAYILRESVVRLYNEQIVSKVTITEEEIAQYYKENHENLTLNVIEADSEIEAGEILQKLESGEEFEKFALDPGSHSEKQQGKGVTFKKQSMRPAMQAAVSTLKPGEMSGIIKDQDKYYIVKLLDRQAAPEEALESAKGGIKSTLKNRRIKELTEKYLLQLREKAAVKIDRELLASIKLDGGEKSLEEWSQDKRPLVQADNLTLTVGDFIPMIPKDIIKPNEEIINNWLNFKLVDLEALSLGYDVNTGLKDMVQRYKNVLLKTAFTKRVIIPGIKISNEDAEVYYLSHQDDYVKPEKYKIQQITLNSQEDAQDILNSISGGANFSWLAKAKSKDMFASTGGVTELKTKEQLPEPVKVIIDGLKQGDISPILQLNSQYLIFRLIEKSGREVEAFSNVKELAYKAAYNEKYKEVYNGYIDKLRKDARIVLNDEAIQSFKETFKK